jgi:uncharacterized Tic20 family protein
MSGNSFDAGGAVPPQKPIVDSNGLTNDDRTWGMMAHLSGILAAIVTGFLGGWAGPLIVWLVKKDQSEFVADQGKEALNFQLTLMIGYVLAYGITIISCGMLFFVLFVPMILQIVFCIIACTKANTGERYRYPINIRFIS